MTNTSVVIPCINSEEVIVDCLKSLDDKKVPVFIIDNGSNDQTLSKVKKLNFNTKIFKSKINLGWGNAANLAISQIKTNYALLLNPDVRFITKKPIEQFESQIKLYNNIGMATAQTYDKNLKSENSRITFFSNIKKKNLKLIRSLPEGSTCGTKNCVYGGAIIFFETHGSFDR